MNTDSLGDLSRQYAQSVAEVVETTADISLALQDGASPCEDAAYVAIACLQGEESGILALRSNADTLRILTAYMTGLSEDEVTEDDLQDCLHEIINMTIGIVKTKSSAQDAKHQIAAPFVLTGEGVRFLYKRHAMHAVCHLAGDALFIEMHVFF